jgi:effector-binding domain-containing protein
MRSPRIAFGAATLALACVLSVGATFAQTPTQPPAQSQTPTPPPGNPPPVQPVQPAQPAPQQPGDPFGEEVTLPERTIVYLKGVGNWDSAYETLVDAFKSVYGYLDKEGIKPAGLSMTIYTQTDDTGFDYQAAVPIAQEPKTKPQGDIAIGKAPSGKALKFIHRGSYDAMDSTYEAITNYLDEKRLEAKDIFIEEYQTDPTKTPDDKLVVNIYVPTK